jgi:hypothetical protein
VLRAWAECSFVDPIADIAVLGSPDDLHADDYKALMGTATVLSLGDPVRHSVNFWAPARLLSLDGWWFSCTIPPRRRPAVDHSRRRARPRRDVGLADRLGLRDGDRGRVHHDVAQGGRS